MQATWENPADNPPSIRVSVDAERRTIKVWDNGHGMNAEQLKAYSEIGINRAQSRVKNEEREEHNPIRESNCESSRNYSPNNFNINL